MPSLVETVPAVLEEKLFKNYIYIFTFLLPSPLKKGQGPSFEQNCMRSPLTQECSVPSLVEIGLGVQKKK